MRHANTCTLLLIGVLVLRAQANAQMMATNDMSWPGKQNISKQHATVNGVELSYLIGGGGLRVIVLLHGFPESSYTWRKVMPALAAAGYTVIAPDLRGMGDSEIATGGYDKKTLAADIFQLTKRLGHERFYLVGHDFGGSVAYALAAAHPEAVRRLAVMECLPAGLLSPDKAGAAISPRFKELSWFRDFHKTARLPEELITGREKQYLAWLFDSFSFNRAAISDEDINEYARSFSKSGALHAALEYYRSETFDLKDNQQSIVRKLAMPVLAIGGDGSLNEATILAMRAAASDVRGEVLKETGHFIPEERAEYLTARLLEFFGEKN